MTLAEFLLARISETESLARQAIEDNGFGNGTWLVRGYDEIGYYIQDETRSGVGTDDAQLTEGEATHIAYHDPNRVLAECEAKRQIVDRYLAQLDRQVDPEESQLSADICVREYEDWILPALALPFADHPDYEEEWKP